MARNVPSSTYAPISLAYGLLVFSVATSPATAIDITSLFSSLPDLSSFSNLLSSTGVASEIAARTSITILAVPNSYLNSSAVDLTRRLSPSSLADLLRYHVLLRFLSASDLQRLSPSGSITPTLFQTTGRAPSSSGSLNLTRNADSGNVTARSPQTSSNATVLSVLQTLPYNVSVLAVDSLLIPYGFDLMASESRPPLGLNITKALLDGHDFNVAASLLAASGVASDFEEDERGAGITLFVPTDEAFMNLPGNVRFQSLPADKKAVVLKFHVLHSYYPLGSLESIVNPVQPTLATEEMGAGSFTLNISRINGSVAIDTGIVQAAVTQTVFDQNPVSIFGVSEVLLPKEIFGKGTGIVPGRPRNEIIGASRPPDMSPDSEMSPSSSLSPLAGKEMGGGPQGEVVCNLLGLLGIAISILI